MISVNFNPCSVDIMPRWGVFSTVGRPAPQELVKKVQKSIKQLENTQLEKDKREQELKHIR